MKRRNSDDRYQELLRKVRAGDEDSVVLLARMIERLGRAPDEESIKTAAAKVLGTVWIVKIERPNGTIEEAFALEKDALSFASEWALRVLMDAGFDDEADEARLARNEGDHERALDVYREILSDQGGDALNDTFVEISDLRIS